ncbi:MAG TPA: DMT family transporter [Pseudomonadota bacterium]|nr:DMT family transporter [Pseudomonadota bacterium]
MTYPSLSIVAAGRSESHERLRGIASMIGAVFVFAIMDAQMKRLSVHYGPFQVSCLRCVSSLLCLLPTIAWKRSWAGMRARTPWLHLVRGALGVIMLGSFVYAVRSLSLAQTYSVFLAAPLLMTALSVPLLREQVSGRRWTAILAGLGGVLLMLQPWGHGLMSVSLAAASAAALATICYSLSALTVRWLGRSNSNLSMVFWYLLLVSLGSGALAIDEWRAIEPGDWLWLLGIGVSGVLGQFWVTDAFRRAPPSVVGPFEYTSILWAFAIDWIFWSAVPSVALLIGGGIVVVSGTFVIWDEHRADELALNPASPPP